MAKTDEFLEKNLFPRHMAFFLQIRAKYNGRVKNALNQKSDTTFTNPTFDD